MAIRPDNRTSVAINLVAVICLAAFGLIAASTGGVAQSRPSFGADEILRLPYDAVPGEIVVEFRDRVRASGATVDTAGETINLNDLLGEGARVAETLNQIGGVVVDVPALREGRDVDEVLNILRGSSAIAAAEPNYVYYMLGRPSDPMVGEMWFLEKISAFKGWDYRSTSPDIIVAVIDSGIHFDHEDLQGQIWRNTGEIPDNGKDDDGNGYKDDVRGWNFFANNADAGAEFVRATAKCKRRKGKAWFEYHGTHVAATIGAIGNNRRGVVGVTQRVRIMPLKVFGGPCGVTKLSNLIQAVKYATDSGAHIINMSLGGPSSSAILRRQIEAAIKRGIIVAAAAGNNGSDNDVRPMYPANYPTPGLISVAATDRKDSLAKFSNFGLRTVDLAAPGVDILSAVPGTGRGGRVKSEYRKLNGTSMATPIVAGALALMLAHNSNISNLEIEKLLLGAVDPVPGLRKSTITGGRLNMEKALRSVSLWKQKAPKPKPSAGPPKPRPKPVAKRPRPRRPGGVSPRRACTPNDILRAAPGCG